MSGTPEDHAMAPAMRAKLVIAVCVFAALAVLTAGHAAVQMHAFAETRDSLSHWRARLDEATAAERGSRAWRMDPPERRIHDLEAELERIKERFFVSLACFVLFGGFVFVGGRAWLRGRR